MKLTKKEKYLIIGILEQEANNLDKIDCEEFKEVMLLIDNILKKFYKKI